MISLSASLLAHQRGRARRPALRVLAMARRGGHEILRWSRHHQGAESGGPHAAALAADGSLIRARNDDGTLYVERVADPGPESGFGTWSSPGGCTAGTGVALAARTGEVLLVYVDGGDVQLRTSADDGASWSSATALVTAAAEWVAVALVPSGDACLFYSVGGTVSRLRRTGGAWAGSGTAWTNSATDISGLAALHFGGDYHLLVTGTEATTLHPRAWGTILGDGNLPANLWTGLKTVTGADAASTASFAGPHLAALDGRVRGSLSRVEAGPVAVDRPLLAHPAGALGVSGDWSEPAPFDAETAHGLALTASAATVWGCTASEVWSAPRATGIDDLSERVTAATAQVTPHGAHCRVELALDAAGLSGFPGLAVGGSIELWPGYRSGTEGSAEFGASLGFIVGRISLRSESGRLTAVIEGHGIWEELARFRQPQVWQVAGGTAALATIHLRLAARAGFTAASDPSVSSTWTGVMPAFAIAAGEALGPALERLLATVTDAARHDSALVSRVVGLDPEAAAVHAYGPGEHPVNAVEVTDAGTAVNAVRLQGPDRYADAFAPGAIERHGLRQALVRHLEADSDAKAAAGAAAALAGHQLGQVRARLTVPVNAGAQLYDVVTLAAPELGLTEERLRVSGLELAFERRPGRPARYEHLLTLAEP